MNGLRPTNDTEVIAPPAVRVCDGKTKHALDAAAVHLYDIDLSRHYDDIESLRNVLSDHERTRAARFVTERLQHDYIVSHGVTRLILSRYVASAPEQLVFVQGEHGKPALDPSHSSSVRFNLSHSGNKCLIAVTNAREVGVDVEKIRPLDDWFEIAKRFFSARETEQLLQLPEALRRNGFFATWSRKEAYIKAIGMGLALELGSFAVEADPRVQARLLWTRDDAEEPAHWEMRTLRVEAGYHAALAVRGPIDVVAVEF
ncbi:MAG TPA: 4'-phosphopantetheinyl transferase superfamily protein [Polyangiaceae bacterium]|nr:4'-phosphopantetheinyl transferase superfamily protein [Polyangiaceae bacterium]